VDKAASEDEAAGGARMKVGLRGCVGLSDYQGGEWFFRFLAKCIRFFTKSRWSHTFCITMEDDLLGPIVEEAGPHGVGNVGIDKYIDGPYYFKLWRVKAAPDQIDAGIRRVFNRLGVIYGYFQLIGFVLVWVWYKLTLRKANNPFRAGIICSELVLMYLQSIFPDNEELAKMNKNLTSPEDIQDFIEANPSLFEEIPIPEVTED
jgi:hypothetical protein